ncbi:hypothetical protein DEA8626_03865 [Defluviimonas aquaemixtae]|uniref:Probable membrane transporter protein n=1 Tax=Albidovulum aquaemixtae TaxID=1542388 RepID=A0A2R8BN90_9RHOB|nr:sulfite exporter TauE/SafE family protein [Defluviimonas aquaemixtae]SPH24832.1 hypothetical protein DEA8626_03865 [Defluviimonas aquaemixtae]
MEGPLFWTLAVLASVSVGLSKGGLPVVAMLSVPVLALVLPPVTAAGLLLPVYVVSDMFGLYAYRHAFDKRVLAILAPAAVLGIGVGWLAAAHVSDSAVTGLVGVIGAAFALNLLLRRGPPMPARHAHVAPGLFWGVLTGFTSFVSHAGAPPYQVYVLPLRLTKIVFAGTTTVLFAFVNAVKLIPYAALGQLSAANLKVAAMLLPPSVLAVFAGVWLVRVLPEELFFRLVTWTLLAISLKHLWSAFA